jgi:RNA polymerase sigma-70 factor (ECF subfamily)
MSSEVDFSQIYEEFQPKILHYLSRLTGQQEAEDIAQEVFEKASQGLKSFKGESKLSTWLPALTRTRGLKIGMSGPAIRKPTPTRRLSARR